MLFSLRADPFERGEHESGGYERWYIDHLFTFVPAQAFVAQHLATYNEFPPRQKPGSFSLDQVLEKLPEAGGGRHTQTPLTEAPGAKKTSHKTESTQRGAVSS